MKYEIGTKLEYTRTDTFILEIINYFEDDNEYACRVCEGSKRSVGQTWYKQGYYLDECYNVIEKEPYTEQKSKLVL